jgi:DNA-binding FadR family transcriptional regulator
LPPTNTAARIERALATEILRGDHPPGARLPTVRALAARFAVNPATAQRGIARLERTGLVRSRQGSGTVVNDPDTCGDLSLLPAWLEVLADRPDEAARVLDGMLEVRRAVAARLLVRHRDDLLERLDTLAPHLTALAGVRPEDTDAIRRADIAFARSLVRATGNRAALTVFNAAARLLDDVPAVAEAMYAEPARNAASVATILEALASEADPARCTAAIEAAIEAIDAETVRRFRDGLEGSP